MTDIDPDSGKLLDAELFYRRLLDALRARLESAPDFQQEVAMVGIHSGGAWIARRLHADLKLQQPLGSLDSALYRDDLSERGFRADVQAAQISFEVAGRHIILVDDVLYTGRTVRGALNELFDYGRPARVELAVLVDRGGRELPVAAQYTGETLALWPSQNLVLTQNEDNTFILALETA
ncbi:MAG: bifunctional pyr operon transcriptional regulator/uracil phosphoribosyltransferase PyrR [Burkholderiaceae bacterium]|nr:MAG: bifunctional pyr operon transcriptional regulator/uracil phosphoribosyltransferase PyrR [Burkholderiaceae bacterium]